MSEQPETARSTESNGEANTWRQLAVDRSLDPARVRAEKRVQRFLDAALELMVRSPDREFTVQEVVEVSGQSLRSFYQYFAGKHELLLALFEDAVAGAVQQTERAISDLDDPLERLRVFTGTYYELCQTGTVVSTNPEESGAARAAGSARAARVMADFAHQLLTKHPGEAARAFAPLATRFEALLDEAETAGEIRDGLDHHMITGVVLQAVMFNSFADTISGSGVGSSADALWDLLFDGLGIGTR